MSLNTELKVKRHREEVGSRRTYTRTRHNDARRLITSINIALVFLSEVQLGGAGESGGGDVFTQCAHIKHLSIMFLRLNSNNTLEICTDGNTAEARSRILYTRHQFFLFARHKNTDTKLYSTLPNTRTGRR